MSHGEGPMEGRTDGLDLYSQATKLLSARPPFDGEEASKKDLNLPSSVTQFLDKYVDGKGKPQTQRRSEPEGNNKAPTSTTPSSSQKSNIWEQTEEYFRPLTLSDIENLFPKLSLEPGSLDSCLFIPPVGSSSSSSVQDDNSDARLVSVPVSLSSVPNKDTMEIDEVGTIPVEKEKSVQEQEVEQEDDDVSSLHWMLGSRERFILTSERPNKKHKLLGPQAGLERVLLLPSTSGTGTTCDVCCTGESNLESNKLLHCNSCKISVHQKCFGTHDTFNKQPWLCYNCRERDTKPRPCVLCPKEGKILKPVGNSTVVFAHLFCTLWAPEVYVGDIKSMQPVMNVEGVNAMRKKLVCNVCKVKHGACVRCSHGTCRTSFHPICARESKHQMEIWAKSKNDNVELRAFCSKHSAIQEVNPPPPEQPKVNPPPLPIPQADQNVIIRKVPLLRFTRKNKDKNATKDTTTSNSANLVPKETTKDADLDKESLTPNSPDFAPRLKKMIDSGKINISDLALEVGISSESLEAALVGETTMFSSGLKMKIMKWLEKDQSEKTDPTSPVVKSQPPRQWTKVSLMVLENDKQEDTGSKMVLENAEKQGPDSKVVSQDDEKQDTGSKIVSQDDEKQDSDYKKVSRDANKEDSDSKMVSRDTHKEDSDSKKVSRDANKEDSDSKMVSQADDKEDPVVKDEAPPEPVAKESERLENADLTDGVVSMDHDLCKDDDDNNANVTSRPSQNNGFCDNFVPSNGEGSSSTSYVHPLIKRKLMDLKDPNLKQEKPEQQFSEGRQGLEDQLSKARSLGLLDVAPPEDELEAELIYLQSKLIDNKLDIKQRCEELLEKVVHEIPNETEAVSRTKWDLVVVSHFLREVREVKKRGRKERKHREAAAVMAEATAAVSTSIRRKDDSNIININNQPTSSSKDKDSKTRAKDSTRSKAAAAAAEEKEKSSATANTFQFSILSRDNTLCCDVCMRSETVLNRIFVCSVCKAMVHLDCYHSLKNPAGPWRCELCDEMEENEDLSGSSISRQSGERENIRFVVRCALCGNNNKSGAFRKTSEGLWVHAFCAEWLLEDVFRRGQDGLVTGLDSIPMAKDACCICNSIVGSCLKCSYGDCRISFHPWCARGAGLYMNARGLGGFLQHKAYCAQHSTEQREADNLRYGPEEIKCLKQTRVELEKLRLLCERIIKREKLKRDMVQCSNQILGKRKDCIVSIPQGRSGHTRSGSFHPAGGMSSESATTSINNRSSYNSRTIQQSPDEVTIDSSVSRGRNTVRFSLHPNRETTDDSSTSSFKRKMVDRGPFAGKTVPNRAPPLLPPNPNPQTCRDDADKKSKQGGQLVMTSDQATAQNQRLPKGFAYVPIRSLSKEKPRDDGGAPPDSDEPGG